MKVGEGRQDSLVADNGAGIERMGKSFLCLGEQFGLPTLGP